MMKHFQIYAIGNALVDTEILVDDAFLEQWGIIKGQMSLIDQTRLHNLRQACATLPQKRTGGGSAGNTVVAACQLGAKGFYVCKVAHDEMGHFYAHDLRLQGVEHQLLSDTPHPPPPTPVGSVTGTCLVFVTPDAQRSMCTYLGISTELTIDDLDKLSLYNSELYYMEGYLSASPIALQTALQGAEWASQQAIPIALTLSDVSMVQFFRSGLEAMMKQPLAYLFCNEAEAQAWCRPYPEAADATLSDLWLQMASLAKVVCITRGALGSVVLHQSQIFEMPAIPVQAIDTNGAGDMFAGAFLYGMSQGWTLQASAELGHRAAAAMVCQYGSRLAHAALHELKQ